MFNEFDSEEDAMKVLQWLATAVLVVAGVVLLAEPSGAQTAKAAAFVPTRFTVTDSGTVGEPDVILIPGLASSSSVWDAESKLLAPNYRLHVVQVDGFAGAPAGPNAAAGMLPGIVEELHQYIIAGKLHPVVVGHSLGGLLTMMLADKYPADVSKMVIVDTLPFYAVLFNPAATVEAVKPMAAGIKAQMLAAPADQYAETQKVMMAAMAKSEAGQKAAIASSLTSDRAVVAEALVEDLLTDMRPDMASIKTPTLMLYEYDASSKMPDPAAYEALVKDGYKTMPNVTLVRMDDSKHFIMYDQPVKFDAAVEGFLK
jgi:pimeloyl-ACP methyl ester carboxylesterase